MIKLFNYVNKTSLSLNNKYRLFFITCALIYSLMGFSTWLIAHILIQPKELYILVYVGYFAIFSFIRGYIFLVKHQFNP